MTFDELERRFVAWARGRDDVRAAAVLGSRARTELPADDWSDLDLVVFATDPGRLLDDADWPGELGDVRLTFVEPTAVGDQRERRVLYEGGLDADFSIVPAELLEHPPPEAVAAVAEVAGRGVRVILDRDGRLADVLAQLPEPPRAEAPGEQELRELTHDFWYHAVWAAKKLARGEVYTAKLCVDSYMKRLLVRLLAWHAQARDRAADTWHEGRFLERWADERALAGLRDAYGRYDAADVERALDATGLLFGRVARETAARLGLAYDHEAETHALAVVRETLAGRPRRKRERRPPEGLRFAWREEVADAELVRLTRSHGGRAEPGWWDRIRAHSLGWVTARLGDGTLVGFVNVAWDGGDHAFLLDTKVRPEFQRRGVGTELVCLAVRHAREAGCEWIEVDFDHDLAAFYFGACGFRPTTAGLVHLPTLPAAGEG